MSNNLTRIVVAAIAIPIAIAIVYWGGLPLAILVALLAGIGAKELLALAERQGIRPLTGVAVVVSAALPIAVWIEYGGRLLLAGPFGSISLPSTWFALAAFVLVVLIATLWRRAPTDRPLEAAAITLLAPLYCAVLPSFLLGVRYGLDGGRPWAAVWAVFFPLAVTWICDSFAMWGGKLFGGPKLSPVVSPGKTKSGFWSGIVGGIVAAIAFNRLAMIPSGFTVPDWQAAIFGLVLAVVATVGDLAESLFKRQAGVKDSSALIPGHGGVLDRLDSLYFVIPVATMLYRLFGVI